MELVKEYLKRLKITLPFSEISGLLIYIALSVIILFLSFIHPFLFILLGVYFVFLFKKSRILFYYSLIITFLFLIYYICYYLYVSNLNFEGQIEGIIALKEDNYFLVYSKMHYIKVYYAKSMDLVIGKRISVIGNNAAITSRNVEHTFSYYRYKISKRIYGEMFLRSYAEGKTSVSLFTVRGKILEYIEKNYSENSVLYLKQLILGITSFDSDLQSGIKDTGIAYLFAISGLHVSIMSSLIKKLLDKMNVPFEIGNAITILFLVSYALIASGSVSITRAVVMSIIMNAAEIFNKKIVTKPTS